MSDITHLTQKIMQDAHKKHEQYITKAQHDIKQKERLRKNQIRRQVDEDLKQFEKELRANMSLKVSDLHVKSRADILSAKQRVLNELFTESLHKIRAMNEDQFNHFVIVNIKNTPLKGDVELVLGSDSQNFSTAENHRFWQENAAARMNLIVSEETLAQRGGFLLRQEDIEYNFTFESLLNAAKEELSVDLLNLVFAKE